MIIPDRLRPEIPDKKQHSFMADLLRTILEKIYENKDIDNNEISDLISLWNAHSPERLNFMSSVTFTLTRMKRISSAQPFIKRITFTT